MQATIKKELPAFEPTLIEKLDLYSLALIHAHRQCICVKQPPERLKELITRVRKARGQLQLDVECLASRGIIRNYRRTSLRLSTSHRNLASDVLTLAEFFRKNWSSIANRSAVTLEELDQAEGAANDLIAALGLRDRRPEVTARAAPDRQKVFTLCCLTYDEVRRALMLVRWDHGDAINFPRFEAADLAPWVESAVACDGPSVEQIAEEQNTTRKQALAAWSLGEPELTQYSDKVDFRVITPGSSAGELLHVLSSLERRSEHWDTDPECARDALSAAVSLVLRLLGRDPDPAKSREHVLLSVLAERRLRAGESASLGELLEDLNRPPINTIGALSIDAFLPKAERKTFAAALNTLLASPTFASWREGTTLDIGEWLKVKKGKTPAVIVSVAHLDDEERALVLGVLLEEVLSWVRSLPGSSRLKALIVFDEVYGFLPPHPKNPPTKRPIVALMKQARAFGVGVLVATQNPMDVDYRALGNAGVWCIGRLQTDADCARVLDGFAAAGGSGPSTAELGKIVKNLAPRWFLLRDVHARIGTILLQPRWAMSLLREPMTRNEIKKALESK